jgi:hypothetical protein
VEPPRVPEDAVGGETEQKTQGSGHSGKSARPAKSSTGRSVER